MTARAIAKPASHAIFLLLKKPTDKENNYDHWHNL